MNEFADPWERFPGEEGKDSQVRNQILDMQTFNATLESRLNTKAHKNKSMKLHFQIKRIHHPFL